MPAPSSESRKIAGSDVTQAFYADLIGAQDNLRFGAPAACGFGTRGLGLVVVEIGRIG